MLETSDLQKLARRVFAQQMPKVRLEDLRAEPFIGSEGDDKLKITLLFTPEEVGAVTGDNALKLLLAMNDALQLKGEERFASIEYATTDDVPFDED